MRQKKLDIKEEDSDTKFVVIDEILEEVDESLLSGTLRLRWMREDSTSVEDGFVHKQNNEHRLYSDQIDLSRDSFVYVSHQTEAGVHTFSLSANETIEVEEDLSPGFFEIDLASLEESEERDLESVIHPSINQLTDYLNSNNLMVVPPFQRSYCWGKREIEILAADIRLVLEGVSHYEFLGSVITSEVQVPGTINKRAYHSWVVDGQQRLTTLYLSVVALVDLLQTGDASLWKDNQQERTDEANDIRRKHLTVDKKDDLGKPTLSPALADMESFACILEKVGITPARNPSMGASQSKVMEKVYKEHILTSMRALITDRSGKMTIERLESVINVITSRLLFIEITPKAKLNTSRVFERINDQGIKLTVADLVKNRLLEPFVGNDQELHNFLDNEYGRLRKTLEPELYSVLTKSDGEPIRKPEDFFDEFLLPYARLQGLPKLTSGNLFSKLKSHWSTTASGSMRSSREAVSDMQDYAKYHLVYRAQDNSVIDGANQFTDRFREAAGRLGRTKFPTPMLPYLMSVAKHVVETGNDVDEAICCLEILESFYVRRQFTGHQSAGFQSLFADLWSDLGKEPNAEFLAQKLKTSSGYKFPEDDEFRQGIKYKNLYSSKRLMFFVLTEYEIYLQAREGENGALLQELLDPKAQASMIRSAEHIVPTNLKQWKDQNDDAQFWPELDAWHREYKNTWANLVLFEKFKNSEASNKVWRDKLQKYRRTRWHSAHELLEIQQFDRQSYDRRLEKLSQFAVERWAR